MYIYIAYIGKRIYRYKNYAYRVISFSDVIWKKGSNNLLSTIEINRRYLIDTLSLSLQIDLKIRIEYSKYTEEEYFHKKIKTIHPLDSFYKLIFIKYVFLYIYIYLNYPIIFQITLYTSKYTYNEIIYGGYIVNVHSCHHCI